LGTNIWNTPQLVSRAQRFVENALFVDAMPPSERPQFQGDFYGSYRAVFGEEPGLFEAQGYEAGLALRQALASGETTRIGLQQRLARLDTVQGPIGPLTMSPSRELRRRLTALTVLQGQIQPEVDFPAQ
jgi:ABC-type branched-subunit amino acid transport system substrate-binding protein